jgi:hypothetical protein
LYELGLGDVASELARAGHIAPGATGHDEGDGA